MQSVDCHWTMYSLSEPWCDVLVTGNPDRPQGFERTEGMSSAPSPSRDATNTGLPVITKDVILPPENRISMEAGDQSTIEGKNETRALPEEVLKALGKRIAPDKIIGPAIHEDISERWLEVLKKGLTSNDRSEILKKHPIPENCTLMDAPKLNPELKAAATEAAITRDIRIASKQERIAGCLTASGRALSIALNGNGDAENLLIIEYLCDTGKLLSDLQREESSVRKSLILTGVNGPIKEMIQNSDVDEWLCGKNLEEKLKSVKSVERSLKDLKPPPKNQSIRNPKNFRAPLGLHNQKSQTATMGGQKYTSRPQKGMEPAKTHSSQRTQSNQPYRKSYQQKDRSYSRHRR